MGQATPIRVQKLVRVEVVTTEEVELAYQVEKGGQLVLVMTMPAFRDAAAMQGAIAINQ